MRAFVKTLSLLVLSAWLTGCTSTSVTNLTPRQHLRNADGVYLMEAEWRSNQANIRKETIKPYVVIGLEEFPMRRTLMLPNRWEALVPIATQKSLIHYRFKFDFNYAQMNGDKPDSKLSMPYQLEIKDK